MFGKFYQHLATRRQFLRNLTRLVTLTCDIVYMDLQFEMKPLTSWMGHPYSKMFIDIVMDGPSIHYKALFSNSFSFCFAFR